MKKFAFVVLLLGLLLSFAACGDSASENSGSLVSPDYVYVPEYFNMNAEEIDDIQYSSVFGDELFFAAYGVIGTREPSAEDLEWNNGVVEDWMTEEYGSMLYKAKLDGSNATKLENFQPIQVPEGQDGSSNVSGFVMDTAGNIWVAENLYTNTYDDSGEWTGSSDSYFVRKLDQTGTEISRIDLAPITADMDWFYLQYMCVDNEGRIYFTSGDQKIYAMSAESGALEFEIPLSDMEWVNGMVRLANGKVGVGTHEQETGKFIIKEIDPATKAFGKTYDMSVPVYMNTLYNGGGEYAVYCSDDVYLYGLNTETGECTALLNWIDSDVNTNDLRTVLPLEDGRILCISYYYRGQGEEFTSGQELVILTKTPASEVKEKTIITMACMWLNYNTRAAIIDFNKTNPDYRIQVTDYSQYNTEEDYEAGLTKLNTEIISGKVPDILDVSNLPMDQYAAKGLLEDLYTYIDSDSELSRDGLVTEALKAMEVDGHLYQASSSFGISTLMGDPDVVGTEPGWTFDELKAVMEAHPEASAFSPYTTQDTILYYSYLMNQSQYVDWQTGECKFNSDDFIAMLEFVNTFPKEYDWENEEYVDEMELIAQGKILLSFANISSFDDISKNSAQFGGDVTYIGFPSSEGCGSVLTVDGGLAMSSASAHKDGAWAFIRTVFTEDYQKQNTWQLPTNRAIFEMRKEEAMTDDVSVDENGNETIVPRFTFGMESGEYDVYAMTQEQYDQFLSLLNLIDSTVSYDTSIIEIIREESASFFAGQKSAKETADVIQSRVSIYVNEQR